MWSSFRDLSVRWKVISVVMLVTAVALGTSVTAVVVMDVIAMREALKERVGALSRVAAINTAAALAFGDAEGAEEVLSALGTERDVIGIQIRTLDGAIFARYLSARSEHASLRARVEADEHEEQLGDLLASAQAEAHPGLQGGYLHVSMAVRVNDKTLGFMHLEYDTTDLGRRILYQALLALVVFIGGMGVAFLLAVRLHRVISRPIGEIAEAMEETAAKQDFSIRLDVHQRDELGTLMRAFNTMLEQVDLRDAELRKARDAAEAGSEAKSQFLVSMSHEIRTPMNGILGMAELLAGTPLDARQRHFIQTIQVSADSLLAIINDILDFSKIEAGRLELEHLDFDLCEVIERAMDLLAEGARAKGLSLRTRIPAGFPSRVRGDPGRLQQILTNLLSNAIKFTERGHVQLGLACLEQTDTWVLVRITVADTGIGLAPEQQRRVFERFSQADSSTSRRYGGTGLGLSISKQLIELLGGRIELQSAPGRGSVLRVDLGLERQAAPSAPTDAPRAGLRVLLVTRDARAREGLAQCFAAWDARLHSGTELQEALALALTCTTRGEPFDVLALEQAQLPEPGSPAGRVLRDLIGHAQGALVLAAEGTEEGVDLAWGYLPVLAASCASRHLARTLGAMIGQKGAGLAPLSVAPPSCQLAPPPLGLSVLVAEDNAVNQEVIESMLLVLGCRVTLCADGRAALDAATRVAPDLILMDCQMPEIDGYETARRLRAREQEAGGHVPIIALTAHAMRGDRERALAAGMDDYLSKPFKLTELTELLQHWAAGMAAPPPAPGASGRRDHALEVLE